MDILSNKEILDDYTLKTLVRYNHRARIKDESVAEHSYFVILFCLKIMSKMNLSKEVERLVLINAVLHDVSESKISDIPYDVKYDILEIGSKIKEVENNYIFENWNYYYNNIYDNNNQLVNDIVKLADVYSVKQYCLMEMKLGNNSDEILKILTHAEKEIVEVNERITNIMEV